MANVNESVNTIATAIEEQSSVTKDIARNVGEAASGVKDANQRVAQISTVSQSVAKDIAGVNQASADMASGSEQVLASAAELSRLSEELQRLVGQFRLKDEPPEAGIMPDRPVLELGKDRIATPSTGRSVHSGGGDGAVPNPELGSARN